jgi:hypothetical protein
LGAPTQAGTTPNVVFRAVVGPYGESVMDVTL